MRYLTAVSVLLAGRWVAATGITIPNTSRNSFASSKSHVPNPRQ